MLGLTRDVGEDPFEPRARARKYCCCGAREPTRRPPLNPQKPHQTAMRGAGACTLRASPRSLPMV